MLIKLTHPEPNYEFWVDCSDISVLERYNKPASVLIKLDDKPSVTAIVLKSGRIMSCKETPDQIMSIIQGYSQPQPVWVNTTVHSPSTI